MSASSVGDAQRFDSLSDLRGQLAGGRGLDIVCGGRELRVDGDGRLLTPEGAFGVTRWAWAGLWRWAGVAAPARSVESVNAGLRKCPTPLLVRVQDGVVMAVLSFRYTPVAHLALVDRLEGLPELQVLSCWLTPRLLRMTLATRTVVAEPRVGGIVRVGLEVVNSEVGAARLTCAGYLYRLVCANGALYPLLLAGTRLRHYRHAPEVLLRRFDEALREVAPRLPQLARALERTAGETLGPCAYGRLRRRLRELLGERQTQAIFNDLMPQSLRYDAFNRITALAQRYALGLCRPLEALAGTLLLGRCRS